MTKLLCRLGSRADAVHRAARFMALTRYPESSHFVTADWNAGELRGLAYAGQRNAFGIPVGAVYLGCDDYVDNGVIARDVDRPPLLSLAIRNLLRLSAVHTIMVRDQPLDVDSLPGLSPKVDWQETRSVLPLAPSFEEFLQSLGKQTRRNLMYYRRRALTAGCAYREELSSAQLNEAIAALLPHQRTSSHSRHAIAARCEVLRAKQGSFAGVHGAAGEWLAISGTWQEGARAFMTFQINHDAEEHRRASLSTVLRSWLIESLIERGARELVFVGGCKGILEPFCQPVRSRVVTIEKRGPVPSFRRALLAGALKFRSGPARR